MNRVNTSGIIEPTLESQYKFVDREILSHSTEDEWYFRGENNKLCRQSIKLVVKKLSIINLKCLLKIKWVSISSLKLRSHKVLFSNGNDSNIRHRLVESLWATRRSAKTPWNSRTACRPVLSFGSADKEWSCPRTASRLQSEWRAFSRVRMSSHLLDLAANLH